MIWIGGICLFSIGLFYYLLQQSKKPTGLIGLLMMRIWNMVYMPLVKWSLTKIKLPIKNNAKLLDIGIGNGASTRYLSTLGSGLQVTGIDIAEQAIKSAQKIQTKESIDYQVMDVQNLQFDNQTFNLITAFQSHFH